MADWSWSDIYSIAKVAAASTSGHLCVHGAQLWVILGSAYPDRVFYSNGAGEAWQEDLNYPSTANGRTSGARLVSFQGYLYAIRNIEHSWAGRAGSFDVIRRNSNGTWTKVDGTAADSDEVMIDACGGPSVIMIVGGTDTHAGGPHTADRAMIWRYDTTNGLIVEYDTGPKGPGGWPYSGADVRNIHYSTRLARWYAAWDYHDDGGATLNVRILRRTAPGTWVVDDERALVAGVWQSIRHFADSILGLFSGGLYLATGVDAWAEYANNDKMAYRPYQWGDGGHIIGVEPTASPYDFLSYFWKPGWAVETTQIEDTQEAGHNYIIGDYISFRGCLYAACDVWAGALRTTIYKIVRCRAETGLGIPPFNRGDSKALVCDHQYGDTLYIGLRDESMEPIILWLDWDFEDFFFGYDASGGSAVGVQTVETRDECFGYGQFGTDKQIILSEDKLETWDEAQGEFGDDEVTTLQFHPSDGQDLVGTRRLNQDLIRTLNQRSPWNSVGPTPFVARSQLRVQDDIFIGADTPDAQPVRMYNETSGSWTGKSSGLPTDVAINDLELGF